MVVHLLTGGYKLNTGLTHMQPVVKGKIKNRKWDANPRAYKYSEHLHCRYGKDWKGLKEKLWGG